MSLLKRAVSICLLVVSLVMSVGESAAANARFLAHEDIILYGMGLKVEPARQVVPKNIATIVSTYMQVPTLPTAEIPPLAADALVKGTLRGPGLQTPLELSATANSPFNIPPLTVPGIYSLDNIRLESGGKILFRGTPESVSIEIIEKLLVTQITARPLTAQEIKDKGIVFDKSNFQAFNFTAAFAVGTGDPVRIDMPVLLPNLAGAADVTVRGTEIGSLAEPQLKDVRTIIPDALKLAQTKIPNLSVQTFNLTAVDFKGNSFVLPPIPGVIVIPGDIGFLNQYFSVMLMVGNVAPEYSNLVVQDLTATILLPSGNDKVVGSSDDPLAMAVTTSGPAPMLQAVVQPGLDGKLGTADDIISLAPGQSGNAEFLVEGRREGSHTIEMEITGTLEGLPIGPVTVRGRAMGTVLVRNPNFTLTFTHPDIVNAGEEYVLDVTVTNTSAAPANFVSVNLHQQQISGADLVGEGSKEIETIPPGDSATVSFDLRSKVSGPIFAATLDSDEHVSGRFQLKTSVGELGIPLSPDSLVLPKEAGSLPKALRVAALGLLGKAYAVATAPAAALPKDIIRFGKKIVWDRGIEVAQAGFRFTLHEPLPDTAVQLLLDFMGSNYSRLSETNPLPANRLTAESDFSGFDDLRRRSIRGDVLADAVANLLKPDLAAKGGSDFQRDLASKIAYRPEHLSVMLDSGSGPLPVSLTLIDSQGRKLGGVGEKGKVVKEIPNGDYLTFKDQTTTPPTTSGQLAIIAVPTAGAFRIRVERLPGADPAATFNLGIVVPDASGALQQLSFSGITTGSLPTIDLPGSPYNFSVEMYADGLLLNGTPHSVTVSRPVPDIAPSVVSVVQQPEADKIENGCGTWRFGRVVAVLFSEEVTAASVHDKLARAAITNYTLDGNQVVGVALQPGNRIAFLALRDPVGQFVPRSISFDNISDRRGNLLANQSVPIEGTINDPGAVVSGKVLQPDGVPLSGAEVRLFTLVQYPDLGAEGGCAADWYGVSSKYTGADAAFNWDYVIKPAVNKIIAVNPEDGEFRSLPFTVARNGQRLNVNIVFLGRGTLTGKILGEDGMTPLKDARIRVTSLTDGSFYGYTTDSTGRFTINKIPVGNLIIEVVHLGTNSKITQSGYIGSSGSIVEMNLVLLTEAVRKITVKYGAISGHVLHYDGATPVAGVPVYGFYQDNSQDGVRCPLVPCPGGEGGLCRPFECAVASATTNAAGAYNFPELPAGDYRVYTFDQGASQEGNARIILAADSAASANILLNGGFGTIKGIVKDADGTPVVDAEVGGGLSLTRTDANGLFTLTDVPVGKRTIVAVSQALLAKGEVTVDISTPGAEYGATIVLQSQGGIFGTLLTADRAPAANIKVYLIQREGLVAVTTSNAVGAYQFANVPVSDIDYSVSAFLPDLTDGNIGTTAIRFQGQRVRLDLTFKGKGTVTGSISNAQGTTGLVGKVSVSALRVVAAQSGQDLIGLRFEYTPHLQIADTTFDNNRFSFSNVFVGPFVITAGGVFSPDPVTFAGEIMTNGDTQNIDMLLTASSVIKGTVFGPDGVSVAKNALITFKSDEFKTICAENNLGETVCTTTPQGIQEETAVSDEFGIFTLPLVTAGKYTITVEERDPAGNPTGRIGKMNGLIRPGQTADVALRLQARAPVRVTVYTHNSTTPVANAWVTIEEAGKIGDTSRPKYKTDANGVVQLTGQDSLNEGSFTVKAESNDGFVGRASGRIVTDGTEVAVNVYLFDHTVTVKGVVYRPDGITPVANAEVAIANASGDLAFAVTNASGEYSQDFIPLGAFRVEVFEAATGRRGFAAATAYLSTPLVTVNISETAIGQVQGTLFQGGALTPLSRWQVTLSQTFPSGRSLHLVATTGLDGRFVFPGVPVGEFRITASSAGQSPVRAGSYLTREGEIIDIPLVANLVKPAFGSINGWVYHPDGTPAADAAICNINPCYGHNPDCAKCLSMTTADNDGRFSFTDVSLGRFAVQAGSQVSSEYGMGYGDIPYAGAASYVKVVLAGLGTVTGTVLDNGVLSAGAKVILSKYPDAGCGAPQCITYSSPTTGQFTFLNVPAYTLTPIDFNQTKFSVPPGTFSVYAEDPTNARKNGSNGGLLNPGGSTQVTVAFADTGSLKVKVLFASGASAPGIVAELRKGGFALYHDTDSTGLVTFSGVPKGDYLLTLQDPAGLGLAKKTVQIVNDLDLSNSPVMLDESPPAVKSSNPLPGEIRVALASPIVITFSEPVQPGSIDATSVTLNSPAGPVEGFRALSVNDTVVTFTPLQELKDESLYTIRVSGVKDRVDRSMLQDFVASFTTVDITPPHIVSFSPTQGSSGAPLESVIRIMFSEPFNPTAFTGPAISVSDANGPLAGRVDLVFGNTGIVFTPLYPLKENTVYTVTPLPASDLSGNQQAVLSPYSFISLDRTPPVISSLTAPVTVIENAVATLTPVFAGGSDIAVVDWYLNGAPAGAVRFAQSATFSFSFQALPTLGIPNGTPIKVSAIATDTSGNRTLIGTETSIAVTTDTPPTATITLPLGGTAVHTSERVVVRVEANDDMGVARIAYQAVGGQFPAADTVAVTPTALSAQKEFAFYVPADAVPGTQIVINATVVDSKGQTGKAAPVSVTVSDATPPVISFSGLSSGAVVRPGQKITAVVTASDLGGIKQVSFRPNSGTPELRDITPAQNSVVMTFTFTVPNGFTSQDIIRLEASATDVAGNSSAAPVIVLPVADTVPPLVTLRAAGGTGFMVPGQTVTIIVDAEDDTAVTAISLVGSGAFTYSDSSVVAPMGIVQKSFTINIPGSLADGAVLTLTATATDAAGNVSAPVPLNLTARALTTVQLPASQLIAAGDTVSLSITLDQAAPAAGVLLNLTPDSAAIQLQPASLTFAAGETVKSFTLTGLTGGSSSIGVAIQGVTLGRVIVTVRGGVVSGTVVTANQLPVAGAEVVINGVTVTSASDGSFLLEGVNGTNGIFVKAFDTANGLQGAVSGVMNAANGFLRGLTVIVSEAGSITGTVKQADLALVGEGVQVDITDSRSIDILLTTFTAADGSYSFAEVPLGNYLVEAHDTNGNRGRSSAYLTVSGAGVTVPVVFLGKGTVTGSVLNTGKVGVSGLSVTMWNKSIFGSVTRSAITDSSGSFTFNEVSVGTFILSTKDDVSNLAASTSGSMASNGQTVTAHLNLAAWASLEGHVYRADGSTPAAGVTVQTGGHTLITDALGAYRFEVLPLGYHTVNVQDPAARAKGQVSVSLQLDRENRVQDITLSGSASIAVTVVDNSSTPVSGAVVSLYDGFGSSTASGTPVFDHVYPGSYEVKAVSGKLHGSFKGSIAVGETLSISVTVAADPSATVAGTVFAPGGQVPAGGVTVNLRNSVCYYLYCISFSMITAGDGTYQFASLPFGSYDLSVTDANSQIRTRATAILLDADGQTATRNLTMAGLGTVNGRVLEPGSSTGSPNMPVTVRSLNPDVGRAYSVRTNAAGFYQVDQVPIGVIAVSAGDISQQKLGDATGTLTGDGSILTLDIALQSNAVTLPLNLSDGYNNSFPIQQNGSIYSSSGSARVFGSTGAAVLALTPESGIPAAFAAVTSGTQEQSGREIALRQADVAGLAVTRKVFVPLEGYFARYLEIFDNLTGFDKTVNVGVKNGFFSELYSSYPFTVASTSNGDALLQAGGQSPDYWAVFGNIDISTGVQSFPNTAMIWGGPGAALPASQAATTPGTSNATGFNAAWDLTVPANGRVAIMHFMLLSGTPADARASAERLVQLPPEALAGLSQDELLAVRNFAVPVDGSSPLTATGTVTGQLLALNGTPQRQRTVTLSGVTSGLSRMKATDTNGNFTFSMVPPGTYRLSAGDPINGAVTNGAEMVLAGGETLVQNLQFIRSGRIAARLFFADGITEVPDLSNIKLEILDAAGAVIGSNPGVYTYNLLLSTFFASNAAELKVRITYTGTTPASVAETAVGGFADASSTPLPVSVSLPLNQGNVTVQLKGLTGTNYSGIELPVTLHDPISGAFWGACTSHSVTGACTVNNLIVGNPGFAAKVVIKDITIAETTAFMTSTGQTQTVILQLLYDPVVFPIYLYDGNGFYYDIHNDGALYYGHRGIFGHDQYYRFPGAMALSVATQGKAAVAFTGAQVGVAEEQGQEISTTQSGLAGLSVNRKVYVPKDGYFARYLDIYTNPTDQPLVVDLNLVTSFSYLKDSFAVRAASDGSSDALPLTRDLTGATWAVVKDSIADDVFMNSLSMPAVALIWGGGAQLAPASAIFSRGYTFYGTTTPANLKTAYQSVTIPAGQSLALMSFLVQQATTTAAQASAERLVQLPPEALTGLSSQELAIIANFSIPANGTSTLAPLPAANGTVTGTLKAYDGQSISGAGNEIYLQSSSPYFTRKYRTTTDNNGLFTFTANPSGVQNAMVLPVLPQTDFTLQGIVSGIVTSQSVSGTFTNDNSTATQDIIFSSTGRIKATLLRFDGTPVTTALVTTSFTTTDCQWDFCHSNNLTNAGNGSYLFESALVGQHKLIAEIPAPTTTPGSGGSSLSITGLVTVAIGTDSPIELRLPLLGSISGTVKDQSGVPVAGSLVQIFSMPTFGFHRQLDTFNGSNGGAVGTFSFTDLPAGTYRLEVQQSGTSNWFYYVVTIAAGEVKSDDYIYQSNGTVSGTVSWADGVAVRTRSFPMEAVDPATGIVLYSREILVDNGTYSFPLSAGSGPVTVRLRLYYVNNGVVHDTWFANELPVGFTGDGQILTVNHTLPVYYGPITIQVEDSNHEPLLKPAQVSVFAADGTQVSDTKFIMYSWTPSLYVENSSVIVRAVYGGMTFEATATVTPSEAVTPPLVVITIPTVSASLQGTVTAGDGLTPLPPGFYYNIEDGITGSVPCGQDSWGNDIFDCYSSDGTFGVKYLYGALRPYPFIPGETVTLTVYDGSLTGLGPLTTTFSFPQGTKAANVTAVMPVFAAKGTVTGADASPAVNVDVTMLQTGADGANHGYWARTDAAGAFTIFGSTTGSYTLTAQTYTGVTGTLETCGSSTPDPCTVVGFDQAISGLNITLEPTGSISGILTEGGNPVSDMTVWLTYPDRGLSLTTTTDAAGGLYFFQVPFGAFTVTAKRLSSNGSLISSSNVVSGTLSVENAAVTIPDLVLSQLPGTVSGIVKGLDGTVPSDGVWVDILRVSDSSTLSTRIYSGGRFGFGNLPADWYLVTFGDYPGDREGPYYGGFAVGQLAEGGALTLDVPIQPANSHGAINLESPGDPFFYRTDDGGKLRFGGNYLFSAPFQNQNLIDGSSASTAGWYDADGQFVLLPWVSAGLIYNRKLYLPAGGPYLRYLETITNHGLAPQSITPHLTGTLSAPGSGNWSYLVDPGSFGNNYAVVQASGDPLMPLVGMIVGGSGTPVATVDATLNSPGAANWTWNNLTVPAGGRVCLLHYIFQADPADPAAATARALALHNLSEPGALDLLTAEERACIANFVVPPAP
ncbi:MAG: carboxypeptidase regulatory-like domain-containing protein [Desulfuromonadaceae bacterium]